MSGRVMLRKLSETIAAEGGDDVIFDQIRAGLPMRKIAEPYDVSRQMIYAWIHDGGEERERAWEAAKADSAHALVDEALDILDGEDMEPWEELTAAKVSQANHRANFRKWLASKRNEEYADKPDSEVNINVDLGLAHLEALKRHGSMPRHEEKPEIEDADYELLPSGDDDGVSGLDADHVAEAQEEFAS